MVLGLTPSTVLAAENNGIMSEHRLLTDFHMFCSCVVGTTGDWRSF